LNPNLAPFSKINPKLMKDLNIKHVRLKPAKLQEERIGKNGHCTCLANVSWI
jgi:hypothetical protein